MKIKEYLQYERYKNSSPCISCTFSGKKVIHCFNVCHHRNVLHNKEKYVVKYVIILNNMCIRLYNVENYED